MTNCEKLNNTCTYDVLVKMANKGTCPLQVIAGISRESKILRCYKYVHDGCCEKCIQEWLNEDFNNSTASKKGC